MDDTGVTLACLPKLMWADRAVRADRWGLASLRPRHLPASLTAGIIRYGLVGRRVAVLLTALGFRRILATSSRDLPDDGNIEPTSLTDLLLSCDVVSLHLPAPAIAGASLCTPGKTRIPNLLIRSQTAE